MKFKMSWVKKVLAVGLCFSMLTGLTDMGSFGMNGAYIDTVYASGSTETHDAIQNGSILQVFCWNFETMIENMDDIAAAGYTAIQTSPINECLATSPELTWMGDGKWYYHYQPTDWTIGNYQLGTREQFIEMCAEADKYGIKVIVDILPNHTTPSTDQISQNLIDSVGGNPEDLFHDTGNTAMGDYNDRIQCTRYAMGGLPDVDTENLGFQEYFFDYLLDCIACGADGFRIDTAKHIALPDDPAPEGVENNFYPNMYEAVTSTNDIFVYGEVLQGANERLGAYQEAIGGTTASSYGGSIRTALVDNDYSVSKIQDYHIEEDATPSKLVTWVESHDNYLNDGTWSLLDEEQIKLGWAIITAREEGSPLFFSRPMGSSTTNQYGENIIGNAGSDIYKDDEVAAVNKFRTAMIGEAENLRNPNNNAQVLMIERGTKGVTIVNGSHSAYALDSETNLADGTYVNMTDDNSVFTVSDGVINGVLPARSVVVLYEEAATEETTVLFYNSDLWSSVSASVNGSADLMAATNDGDGWWRVTVAESLADGFTIAFTNGEESSDTFTMNETSGRYVTGENDTIYASKSAAEEAIGVEKTSVYLLNAAVWDTVYAYAYTATNTTVIGAWPGTAAVYEGDYWWRIDVPAQPAEDLKVIFNNNAGTETPSFVISNTTDVYATNTTEGNQYASKEAAEEAAGVSGDLTTVYYYNEKAWPDVYTYTWGNGEALGGWPGSAAEEVGNGWWKMVIPSGVSTDLNVIFNNGVSDGESGKQQATGAVVSNIRDIYLTYSGAKYASMEAAEEALGISSTESKVYYYDTDEWTTTYVYAKSRSTGTEYLGEWPGTAMTEDANGWQVITIPAGASDDLEVTFSNGNEEDGNVFVVNDRTKLFLTGKDDTAYASKIAAETALGVQLSATTVYFYNCDEWAAVSAYVYGDVGEVFGGWPGASATDEGEGWWSVQVPALVADGFTIIFNNGGNGQQSKDIPMTDQNKVYTTNGTTTTYSSKEDVEAYIADLRSTIDVYYYDTDEWTTTYAYAKSKSTGTEYLGEWPGTAMTEDTNGWQVITIGAAASDDLEVIFSNGNEEEGNTFTVNDRTRLFLTGKDDTAYANKIEAETALGVELSTTTVHFYNGAGWGSVNAYSWNGGGDLLGAWPGTPATDEGDGWWSIEIGAVPASDLFVIFNGGGAQTANLNVTDPNKLYVTNLSGTFYATKAEAEAALGIGGDEPQIPDADAQLKAFVERMYTVALGRDAEAEGVEYWLDLLKSGKSDGEDVAVGFFTGEEFVGKNLSNEEYLEVLYSTFFDRDADEGGWNFYMEKLENGESRDAVLTMFIESSEFEDLCSIYGIEAFFTQEEQVRSFVERMYTVALGRPAEEEGVTYWVNLLLSGDTDGEDVAVGFFTGEEFVGRNLSDEEYLEVLYATFFGKEADEEGWAYNMDLLETEGRDAVFAVFIESDEFDALCTSYGIEAIYTREELVGNFVERMYIVALDRVAEGEGAAFWTQKLLDGSATGAWVADEFISGAEFEGRGLSDREYIEVLYATFFNREAVESDMEYWLKALAGSNRRAVLIGFANSGEFATLCESYGIDAGSIQ